jgi:flagellar biosynthesis protein
MLNKEEKAVALGYKRKKDDAPKILASGKGYIARQLVELAKENGILVHKDKSLVEMLSLLDIDSPIPLEAYAAIAEILTYIYTTDYNYKNEKEIATSD